MNSTPPTSSDLHVMLDIEALGTRPGSAIVELGAVAFSLDTGKTGERFHRYIKPHPSLHTELRTLNWHQEKGTWPPPATVQPVFLEHAITELHQWLTDLGSPHGFWSWGSTYDFPLLENAFHLLGRPVPWSYWQVMDARTIWRLAFPYEKHAPRPHTALEDSLAATADLIRAIRHMEAGKAPAEAAA